MHIFLIIGITCAFSLSLFPRSAFWWLMVRVAFPKYKPHIPRKRRNSNDLCAKGHLILIYASISASHHKVGWRWEERICCGLWRNINRASHMWRDVCGLPHSLTKSQNCVNDQLKIDEYNILIATQIAVNAVCSPLPRWSRRQSTTHWDVVALSTI